MANDSWLTYSTPVRPLLVAGTNTIEVAFASVYDACMFSDPVHSNVTCPGRVYVRQAASSWGWDWASCTTDLFKQCNGHGQPRGGNLFLISLALPHVPKARMGRVCAKAIKISL